MKKEETFLRESNGINCEKIVQALLCRNLYVKLTTLSNTTSSHRIPLQNDLVTGFHLENQFFFILKDFTFKR